VQEKRETFRQEAEKSVKLTFIVDELAKINGISVSDQEVMQVLYYEAMQQGQDPKAYVEMYQKQGVLPAVKMALVEDKLFNKLFDKENKENKGK
jgi:trigger factor